MKTIFDFLWAHKKINVRGYKGDFHKILVREKSNHQLFLLFKYYINHE